MELIQQFTRPVAQLIRIHNINYRSLLPESVIKYNTYQKYTIDNKSYDLYGYNNDVLIDIYPTYKNVMSSNQLPTSWCKYVDKVLSATKMNKIDILIYNKRFKKFTNVIHFNKLDDNIIYNHATWEVTDKWISASKTRNYILNDTILDIIGKKRKRSNFEQNNNKFYLDNDSDEMLRMNLGNIFERDIIDQIIKKYYLHFIKISESYDAKNINKYNDTIIAMKKGIPIIHQAVLHNPEREEYGCVDLIIRSDWIEKMFNMKYSEESSKQYYVIVDIKFHKLQLNTDKMTVRNEGMIKVFKSQLCVYNNALGYMQGFLPKYAYILGSGWSMTKMENGNIITEKCNSAFDRCGIIDFTNKDIDIVSKTNEARKWLRELHENEFDETNPKYNHNYPNMSNANDYSHKKRKSSIAEDNNELTLISYLTPKNRKIALESGINNYLHNDINGEKLGVSGKTEEIVMTLLKNQTNLEHPIMGKYKVMEQKQIELFLDYEFFYNFNTCETTPYLCGIGIVNKDDNKWMFKNIILKDVSEESLKDMCLKTIEIINKYKINDDKIRIYTWSDTDRRILMEQCKKYNLLEEVKDIEWIDGYKFCVQNRINFKGAKSYGLKSIGNALNKHNLTSVNWKSNLSKSNGAYKHYINQEKWIERDNVLYYNEIDCQMIYEIFKNLRKFENNI